MSKPWFVVVDRFERTETSEQGKRLPPYVVGPLTKAEKDIEMGDDEATITFCLLTVDAKKEGYVADDCYATQNPPEGELIGRYVLAAVAPAIAARALREAADEYVKGIYPECGFVESFLHDLAERAEAVGE